MPSEFDEIPLPLGIDGETGKPLAGLEEPAVEDLRAKRGAQAGIDGQTLTGKAEDGSASFGVIGDVDPNVLGEAGWAVMFGASASPQIRQALEPLLKHRREECGGGDLYQEFHGETGYLPGDTASEWLKRRGVRMDVVDPAMGVPFYLMIVAAPDDIPFEFQYALDLYWGVGRLWLETPDQFRQYAGSVVRYETMAEKPGSRRALIFSTEHELDKATALFTEHVAKPLTTGATPLGSRQKFGLHSFLGEDATKANLLRAVQGELEGGTPSLLFLGGHGKGYKFGHPQQAHEQGALICQDWPGLERAKPDEFFSAADVGPRAKLHGTVAFLFACYGGGWPTHDDFARVEGNPKQLAERPSMAKLPQAMLSHPGGGTLAVLAHIDRAWAYSFITGKNSQNQGFRDVMGRVMRGDRLGQATDQFNMRWAALSAELAESLERARLGAPPDPKALGRQWAARDDARNYVVLGDPAVQLLNK
ncbi:MAG: hypothetical protein FJW30_04345 [Acidobacteria bacterium]|nr:hypothetical protein [Acidobacteriota bacterium]